MIRIFMKNFCIRTSLLFLETLFWQIWILFANVQIFNKRKFQLLLSLESVRKPLRHLSDFEGLHLGIIVGWGMGILRYRSAFNIMIEFPHTSNSEINISRSSKIDRSFFIQVWFLYCNCKALSSFYEAIKAYAEMICPLIYVSGVLFQNTLGRFLMFWLFFI